MSGGEPIIPNYASPGTPVAGSDDLVTVATFRGIEAELAATRLEAEGVWCFVADANLANAQPFGPIPVSVKVRRSDAERAREVLERPPERAPDDEYVDEPWRCRRCRTKGLDLVPLTPGQRLRRDAWFVLLVTGLVAVLTPVGKSLQIPDAAQNSISMVWVLTLAGLGLWVILTKRMKRCRACGWTSKA